MAARVLVQVELREERLRDRQGPPGLCTPKTPKLHPKLQPSLCVHNQFSFLRLV